MRGWGDVKIEVIESVTVYVLLVVPCGFVQVGRKAKICFLPGRYRKNLAYPIR
jgi:hypothetical protein